MDRLEAISVSNGTGFRLQFAPDTNSLEFAILISCLCQVRRFCLAGNNAPKEAFLKAAELTAYSSYFKDQLLPWLCLQSVPIGDFLKVIDRLGFINLMFRGSLINMKDIKDSHICYKLSKALDLAIVIYEGSYKQIIYSGNSAEPMVISVIMRSKIYYSFFHSQEMDFERIPNVTLDRIANFPFKIKKNTGEAPGLLSAFAESILSVSNFLDQSKKDELKPFVASALRINPNENPYIGRLRNALEENTSCNKHLKCCFPCKTIHCKVCILTPFLSSHPNSVKCPCGIEIPMKFINELIKNDSRLNKQQTPDRPPSIPSGIGLGIPPPSVGIQNFNNLQKDKETFPNPYLSGYNSHQTDIHHPPSMPPGLGQGIPPPLVGMQNFNLQKDKEIPAAPYLSDYRAHEAVIPQSPDPIYLQNLGGYASEIPRENIGGYQNPGNDRILADNSGVGVCLYCTNQCYFQNGGCCEYQHFYCGTCCPYALVKCPACYSSICCACRGYILKQDACYAQDGSAYHNSCAYQGR